MAVNTLVFTIAAAVAAIGAFCREQRSCATSVGRAATLLGSDGVITEVASPQQCKAAGEKEEAQGKKKGFWMRDPATGPWIPEDHFGDVDIAELRERRSSPPESRR